MKKKILHVAQSNGGVSRYLHSYFKYCNKDKYENILICSEQYRDELDSFLNITDDIKIVDMGREISLLNDLKSTLIIRKLIKEFNPDLIYLHSSKAGVLGRVANLFTGIPCVYNPHGWAFNMKISSKKSNFYFFIEKILSHLTSKIITISEYEKNSAIDRKLCKKDKITVIVNGIDIDEYVDGTENCLLENTLNLENLKDYYVVGMVGRISQQKAPDTFIKVARKIKDQIPNSFFIIVGDGEDRGLIEEMIKKYNLVECTYITGWVDDPYNYIKLFDVATLFSRWEGFGLVLAEYMLCKKPIVATKVDAIPEIVEDNINGLLASVDDIQQLSNCIITIKNNKNLKKQLVVNAFEKVNNCYNVREVVYKHEKLFSKIIK